MAVGMFKLTHRHRKMLTTLFIMLNALQILYGVIMVSSSLYIIIAVAPILQTEKSEISFVFVITTLYGTHVIIHWLIGIRVALKIFTQADKKSTGGLLFLWICVGTNIAVNILIVSHFARKIEKHIARSIKQSIVTGMKNYLSIFKWKKMIDDLQYENECCGVTHFTDWHTTTWLNKYQVDAKSEIAKQFVTTGEASFTFTVVPWSCCKVGFPMQCLHDPLQQVQYNHVWKDEPSMITDSINKNGCLDGLKSPVLWVISVFITMSSLICILHIIIFIVSRILYTSARNAIILGTPDGLAPGWIFGRGDFGYRGGKSLTQIMEDIQKTKGSKYIQQYSTDEETTGKTTINDYTTDDTGETQPLREELQRLQQ